MAAAWLTLWLIAIRWMVGVARSTLDVDLGYWIGGTAIVLLLACGYWLACASRWLYLLVLVPFVSVLVDMLFTLAWYLPAQGPVNTSAAAIGGVIVTIATVPVVAVFVAAGAGAGRLVDVLKRRRVSS